MRKKNKREEGEEIEISVPDTKLQIQKLKEGNGHRKNRGGCVLRRAETNERNAEKTRKSARMSPGRKSSHQR